MTLLVLANLVLAASTCAVVWRWSVERRAVTALDGEPAVTIRLRGRSLDGELVQRCLDHALREAGLVEVASNEWSDGHKGRARVAGRVVGDPVVLIEVSIERVGDVLAGIASSMLGEGYKVTRVRGRRVVLRRGVHRATLVASPS